MYRLAELIVSSRMGITSDTDTIQEYHRLFLCDNCVQTLSRVPDEEIIQEEHQANKAMSTDYTEAACTIRSTVTTATTRAFSKMIRGSLWSVEPRAYFWQFSSCAVFSWASVQ